MNLLFYLGILAIITFFHELGHYLAFIFYKLKPKIRFMGWGITIEDNDMLKRTVGQNLIIYLSGVNLGAICLFFLYHINLIQQTDFGFWFLAYIILSGFDIINIFNILKYKKSYKEPAFLVYQRAIKDLNNQIKSAKSGSTAFSKKYNNNSKSKENRSLKSL